MRITSAWALSITGSVVAETAGFAKAAVMNEVDHGPDISRGDQLASRDGIRQVAEFEIQKVFRFAATMDKLRNREAATDCGGAARASHKNGGRSTGANAMRSVLALGLLITLCASANATTVHHSKLRHVIVRPSQGVAAPPGWYKFPGYPPIPPEENRNLDPSNFGGG